MESLARELEQIDRAKDFKDLREILRDHTIADSRRHDEIMDVLRPISAVFSKASGFWQVAIVLGVIVGFAISSVVGILQIKKMI